jgi:hypothetical protein
MQGGSAQLGTARRARVGRRLFAAASVTALLLVASGCAQGAQQDLADQVARSVNRSGRRALVGRMTVTLRAGHVPEGSPQMAQMAQARGGTLAVFGVALDAHGRRAALLGVDDKPVVLYDASTIYARRIVKSTFDKRLWSRLELNRLPKARFPTFDDITMGAQPGDAIVIGPVLLTDLLSGVLTGSVRQREVDHDGNRRITFNVSISKANRKLHLNDDDRKAREKLLQTVAIKDDIGPGEVVLRKDGSLSRLRLVFAERPDKQTRLDLEAVMTTATIDAQGLDALASPSRATTVRVPAVSILKANVTAQVVQALQSVQAGQSAQSGLVQQPASSAAVQQKATG